MTSVGIVGPGRAGVGIGLALARAGHRVRIHGRHPKQIPLPLQLTVGPTPPWVRDVEVILLAVRDDGVASAAAELAAGGAVGPGHVVLHLSGVLDHTALAAVSDQGAAVGSLHPLQALSDPQSAPERLRGAMAAVEGDERAVERASSLAASIGLRPIHIPAAEKARYHAGAVFASNYLVVVATLADRLFARAGVPDDARVEGVTALMDGTLDNVRRYGPARALTGPVVRGDAATVRRHLAILTSEEAEVYRTLGRAALAMAELDGETRAQMERALGD